MSSSLMDAALPAVTPEHHVDQVRTRGTARRRSFVLRLVVLTLAAVLAVSMVEATTSTADASTVRPGARALQVDVLLDSVETQRAATGYWGAQSVCWGVTAGAWALGRVYGAVLANLVCTTMVSVCAAQAYTARPRKRAGMTFYPFGFFCWKY